MALLKDTEREQLRQLVKASLLEISKLKFELKKCQHESSKNIDNESIHNKSIKDYDKLILKKNEEIIRLKEIISERDGEIVELETIKGYFQSMISRPKKDLTSFQSQLYYLLPSQDETIENLYAHITNIGFSELSIENFTHALKNMERKGYFVSNEENGAVLWKKIEK